MIREFPLPAAIVARAQSLLIDGSSVSDPGASGAVATPPAVRAAATVMLLRRSSGDPGLEVFLLRRTASMTFAAGMHVFPGGGLDERDGDPGLAWHGTTPTATAAALDAPVALARALVVAAVRETFEECGVLLAGRGPDHLVQDVTGAGWEADRLALAAGELGLAEVLGRRGLGVRADLLLPWAHWITPPFERRRYDTRFFLAAMPAGQQAQDLGGEADYAHWLAPAEALRRQRTGEAMLMPPTRVCLEELAAAPDLGSLLTTPRRLRPVTPWVARTDEGRVVMKVDLDGHGGGEPRE